MRAYRIDDVDKKVELGPADPARLEEWLAAVDARAGSSDVSTFGLYRSEADFIELGAVGQGQFLLHSDRLMPAQGWLGKLLRKPHLATEMGRADALACARDYLVLSRAEFERRYG